MQQPARATVVSQIVVASDKDEVVHDEVFTLEVSCLMPMFSAVYRVQVFLPVQIHRERDGISSEVDCEVVDVKGQVDTDLLCQQVVLNEVQELDAEVHEEAKMSCQH